MEFENNPYVSVIIPVRNEGIHLKKTIESLHAVKTMYPFEIIVVDDGSTDNCCDFIRSNTNDGQIKLKVTKGLGSSMARNSGADIASGEYFIFCDAHLTFEDNWMENLLEPIVNGIADASNPGIADSRNPESIGFGYTWNHKLEPTWNVEKESSFYSPLLAGGCLAISSKVFFDVGGFERGFKVWGREDEEFSLKLWLFGYRCIVQPKITILHLFRPSSPPFKITWDDINWNFLRLAYSHFNQDRINKCCSLIEYSAPLDLQYQLLQGDILDQREHYLSRRKYDDNWFMEKFGIPF